VFPFQGEILGATVGTGIRELLQQVFLQFVPEKCPLLVLHSRDLWILELLGIEPGKLHGDVSDGTQFAVAFYPDS
jgi:hypothetical protein